MQQHPLTMDLFEVVIAVIFGILVGLGVALAGFERARRKHHDHRK